MKKYILTILLLGLLPVISRATDPTFYPSPQYSGIKYMYNEYTRQKDVAIAGGIVQTQVLIDTGIHIDNVNDATGINWREETTNWRIVNFTPIFANSKLILRCQFNVNTPDDSFLRHFKFYNVTTSTDVCVGVGVSGYTGNADPTTVAARFPNKTGDNNNSFPLTMFGITNAVNTTPRTYTVYFRKEKAGGAAYTLFNYTSSLANEAGWTAPFVFTVEEVAQ